MLRFVILYEPPVTVKKLWFYFNLFNLRQSSECTEFNKKHLLLCKYNSLLSNRLGCNVIQSCNYR